MEEDLALAVAEEAVTEAATVARLIRALGAMAVAVVISDSAEEGITAAAVEVLVEEEGKLGWFFFFAFSLFFAIKIFAK